MYNVPVIIVLFLFGTIIGSFLNVVVLRYGTGLSASKGRSKCFSCDKYLSWYELIPIVSFVVQRGRCRGCGSKISWQYPLVELAAGLALPIAFFYPPFLFTAILLCLYIAIFVYDLRHKIIPDAFSYGAAVIALGAIGYEAWLSGSVDWMRVVAGPALFLFFFLFWAVSRGTWMGLGDAKLALSIGWFLGLSAGAAAVLMSFWTGAIVSLALMALQRTGIFSRSLGRLGMKSEVPFGPYMIAGFLISLLAHVDFPTLLSFLAI